MIRVVRYLAFALLFAALPAHATIKNQPPASGGGGGGTVTSVSVATANGFAGTVATGTTTPAITIKTTITGLLTGNGTAIGNAAAADVIALWSGTCSASTFLRGDGSCVTPTAGTGTVTSVALTAPSVFAVAGSPITGAGTLAVTFASGQTADQVLATPDQTTGALALLSLTSGYIPATLNGAAVTVVATTNQANTGTPTIDGFATTAAVSIVLDTAQTTTAQNGPWIVQTGAWTRPAWYPTGGTSQVTGYSSVIVRQGTTYQGSTWKQTTAAPITIDTSTTTWAVTPFALNASTVTGTLGVTNGGNGLATAALGDLRYGSGANTLAALPGNTTATPQVLMQTGTGAASAAPAWTTQIGAANLPTSPSLTNSLWTFNFTGQTAGTDIDTFFGANTTPAAVGAQQNACIHLQGNGWKTTATAASQTVDARLCVQPVQGAASPTTVVALEVSINGGAYSTILSNNSAGSTSGVSSSSPWVGTLQINGTGAAVANGVVSGGTNIIAIKANSVTPFTVSPTVVTMSQGFQAAGTKFTTGTSSCGTIGATLGGTFAGSYTSGTTGTCTVLVNLPTLTGGNAYSCFASDITTAADVQMMTASTTASATFSGTTVSGDVIRWGCIGF